RAARAAAAHASASRFWEREYGSEPSEAERASCFVPAAVLQAVMFVPEPLFSIAWAPKTVASEGPGRPERGGALDRRRRPFRRRTSLGPMLSASRPGARYWGSEASGAIPFPGADSMFSSRCGAISGPMQLPSLHAVSRLAMTWAPPGVRHIRPNVQCRH